MDLRKIIYFSLGILVLGLITGIYYKRVDHIYRCTAWILGLLAIILLQRKRFSFGSKVLDALLSPFYSEDIMAILALFGAVHVSLVNLPFTTIDLFHKEWRNADIISHFLGGLVLWLIIAKVLYELKLSNKEVLFYSIVIFYTLAVGWESIEKLSESQISFITESLGNKIRDIIADTLGLFTGIMMVKKGKVNSFRLS
ncbi:hypothetical protein PFDSM3638_07950 [Pyrococcus furiosus DSM 3638]|uniref:Uncharacterized protein n=3 Tax=Pyrococcus furiosus TaxID=2261 RepID=A0A5C0XSH5_PYRFU|nr:hypothetical protein [Pyrococcus furiosus]AAL81699.1 hypothetical protein PF1575 [Pyrococcus furiosus DSM 3638]AFN04357.1 hypothetical protein PFC_07105 [Pyrococcus furiosus COM1]QEK79198.1 hypothetical protein PFDSM3638_07950 [Pyrococcus furiosus DSM 3638]